MIKKITYKHVRHVADLHKNELSGFLPELGTGFLKLLYKVSLELPEMFTFVEEDKGVVKGFVTSTLEINGLYKKIISRSPLWFMIIFLIYFITHPISLIKFIKILRYPGFKDGGAELLSLAVRDDCRLQGIGRKLLIATAKEFKRRGINKFKISVYERLTANGFYKKNECQIVSRFDFLGEKMIYYE